MTGSRLKLRTYLPRTYILRQAHSSDGIIAEYKMQCRAGGSELDWTTLVAKLTIVQAAKASGVRGLSRPPGWPGNYAAGGVIIPYG